MNVRYGPVLVVGTLELKDIQLDDKACRPWGIPTHRKFLVTEFFF